MILVYSSSRVRASAPKGTRYINPGFYAGPVEGAKAVYLNGSYPKIKSDYERAGVPVFDLRDREVIAEPLPAPKPRRRRRKAQ